jgi:hypothetical protein
VTTSLVVLGGCRERLTFDDTGIDAGAEDAPIDPADVPADIGADAGPPCDGPPGLYVEGSCAILAPGVRRFEPEYELWSDGAEKERFVLLPEGERIDTTDPDAWVYPVGTVLFKTFSRDGLRIETRINTKIAEGTGVASWSMRTFAWSEDQLSVTEVTDGVINALGTGHDIPATSLCAGCHSGAAVDVGLGFTAIQLNHEAPEGDVTLERLFAEGRLTAEIDLLDAVVPGDATTRGALGYLHANCGPCHGGPSPMPPGSPMDLWIDVGIPEAELTAAFTTAVNVPSLWPGAALRVAPGTPDESAIVLRMESRTVGTQMPPFATELPHGSGIALVRGWILSLE